MPAGELPKCLFLAGFDQLMLGYEKTESLFLPKEHMRDIFNLAGIVRPAILVNGTVVGWWNLKNRKLKITLFSPADQKLISDTAIGLHFFGCVVITMGAALLCGYVSSIADVLPILIPAVIIYAVVCLICFLLMKQNEKAVNKALEEK